MAGKVILIKGPSSARKSTLARALQAALLEPLWSYSVDFFFDSDVLRRERLRSGEFSWTGIREPFFAGFHQTLPALAGAGNNLLVHHIIETAAWKSELQDLLRSFDVFFIGLHCPVEELERRERDRGDRAVGEARRDLEFVHRFGPYDLDVDSSLPVELNAQTVLGAWAVRGKTSRFFCEVVESARYPMG